MGNRGNLTKAGMGRPKGSRNKLSDAFRSDLCGLGEQWRGRHPQGALLKPDVYLKVVAGLLPAQLNVKVSEIDELTDEQLNRQLAAVVASLQRQALVFGEGNSAPDTPPEAGELSSLH